MRQECPYCSKLANLKETKQLKELRKNTWVCNYCGKTFITTFDNSVTTFSNELTTTIRN